MKNTGKIIAAAIALLATAATAFADLADGLVVKYSFDSLGTGGQLADESGNGHTLTLGSALSLTNGPLPGMKAIRFDGTSGSWAWYAGPALTNRTVSFWTCLDPANSPDIDGVPYIVYNMSTLRVYNSKTAGDTATTEKIEVAGVTMDGTFAFARRRWHHHVLTVAFDDENCLVGGTFTLTHYIDGIPSKTVSATVTSRANRDTHVIIGNKEENGNRALLGNMADFRVWNRALSAEETTALYAETTLGRDPVLVAYWPLDEITETNGVRTSPNKAECDFTTFPDLTIEGESMVQTNGLFGNAVFAGRMACGRMRADNDLEGGLTDWSLSLWMKAPYEPARNNTQRFIETHNSARMLTYMGTTSQQQLRWHLGYGRSGSPYWAASSALFCTNVWLNVTFVQSFEIDGMNKLANFSLYVNGEKLSTSFSQGTSGNRDIPNVVDYVNWCDTPIRIGGRHETSPDTNDSTIDEVAIFSGALTDEQVESLYRGSPAVDAGDDFSTTADAVRLEGRIVRHVSSISVPKPGQYVWRLVSAPPGGEGASFLAADGLATTVTLPALGAYVFELRCTDSLLPRTDTVTVTRVAAGGANVAPTVTLAATAAVTLPAPLVLAPAVTDADGDATVQRWNKVSGPGGVWFDPQADGSTRVTFGAAGSYVVRLAASDGTDEATADCAVVVSAAERSLDDQLLHYWGLNTNRLTAAAIRDEVSGRAVSTATPWWDWPVKTFATGVQGYAFQPDFSGSNICWDTKVDLDETPTIEGITNSRPTNQYVTVSAWVWMRPNDTNNVAGGIVAGQNQSWDLEYAHPSNPNGFSIMQQGFKANDATVTSGIGYSIVHFPAPATPFAGRWTHLVAVLDRWGVDANALYVDGVKTLHTSYVGNEKRAGRTNNADIFIGGRPWVGGSIGTYNGNYTNENGVLSRCFPGIIDEVKIWKRKLSDAEIAYLATTPAEQNREPQVDVPAQAVIRVGAHVPAALVAPTAYDDGLPTGSVLSGEWQVVSGNASAVTFGSGTVTVDVEGEYVVCYAVTDGQRTSYSEPVTVIGITTGTMLIVR